MFLLERHNEEKFLNNHNGTCINGKECRVVVDYKQSICGTSFYNGTMCPLCCRWLVFECFIKNIPLPLSSTIYTVMDGDYEDEMLVPFAPALGITFNMVRYDNTIISPCVQNKLMGVLKISTTRHQRPQVSNWEILICTSKKCNNTVLNIIDKFNSNGYFNTAYDVENDTVVCCKCENVVERIPSDDYGNVFVEKINSWFSRCYHCNTATHTKRGCVQTCKVCSERIVGYVEKTNKSCYYCDIILSEKKNYSSYTIRENGSSRVVYLCKPHTISRRAFTKFKTSIVNNVIDQDVFHKMLLIKSNKRRIDE